jgi:hypothetical protein
MGHSTKDAFRRRGWTLGTNCGKAIVNKTTKDETMNSDQRQDIEFCAWLLRECWGKARNIRGDELEQLKLLSIDDESPLATCLRITKIPPSTATAFSLEASEYYRERGQWLLDVMGE